MQISLAFHVLGMVFWMAGLLVLTGIIRYFESHPSSREDGSYKALTKKYLYGFVVPGVILSVSSGLHQLGMFGLEFYLKQGWMHFKITLVIFLLAVSWILFRAVQDIEGGKKLKASKFGMLHGMVGASLLVILFLTYVGRT